MSEFMFNAPQFYDFTSGQEDDVADSYFEMDHEHQIMEFNEVATYEEISDPLAVEAGEDRPNLRRTSSVGALNLEYLEVATDAVIRLSNAMENIRLVKEKSGSCKNLSKMSTSSAGSSTNIRRAVSRENLNRLAQPKRVYQSQENISMAQAINKFHNATPQRFKSNPTINKSYCPLKRTIPKSPALKTKARHRANTALSREEQEQKEFEEAQRFKIRSQPVSKKVLQGPLKAPAAVDRKPLTQFEPFKLTEVPKRTLPSPKVEQVPFHARPVPKCIRSPAKKLPTLPKKITIPQTPLFVRRFKSRECLVPEKEEPKEKPQEQVKLHATKPIPFSFETRDKQIKKKKEEMINKIMEEEKKAREFHARPVPKKILTPRTSIISGSTSSSLTSSTKTNISEENLSTLHNFKARPAKVLHQKPFVPVHTDRHLIEVSEFTLNTERRAKEREEFDKKILERQAEVEEYKLLREQEMQQEEEEERARLRKEAEHKAQPIRKYREIVIQPSGKVTDPVSPTFMTRSYRKANKENFDLTNATDSP